MDRGFRTCNVNDRWLEVLSDTVAGNANLITYFLYKRLLSFITVERLRIYSAMDPGWRNCGFVHFNHSQAHPCIIAEQLDPLAIVTLMDLPYGKFAQTDAKDKMTEKRVSELAGLFVSHLVDTHFIQMDRQLLLHINHGRDELVLIEQQPPQMSSARKIRAFTHAIESALAFNLIETEEISVTKYKGTLGIKVSSVRENNKKISQSKVIEFNQKFPGVLQISDENEKIDISHDLADAVLLLCSKLYLDIFERKTKPKCRLTLEKLLQSLQLPPDTDHLSLLGHVLQSPMLPVPPHDTMVSQHVASMTVAGKKYL